MVPSAALASFPLVCSSTITSPLSPVPDGSFSAGTSMNFSMSGLASTAPVFIGTTTVVTPKVSPTLSVDPQQPSHSTLHLNPELAKSCGAVKLDSPVCMGHPVTFLKLQQVRVKGGWVTVSCARPLGLKAACAAGWCQNGKLACWELVSSS